MTGYFKFLDQKKSWFKKLYWYLGTDGGNGIDTGVDPEAVPVHQLLSLPSVKAHPRRVAAVRAAQNDKVFSKCRHYSSKFISLCL
jgi:hypothetical protein